MAWYNKISDWVSEKRNPAQHVIRDEEGVNIGSNAVVGYRSAFKKLESVNRGTNLIVSACSSLDYDIKDKISDASPGIRQKSLNNLLNFKPNPHQSAQDFRTNIFTDFILEGNIFIYFDGAYLYHLPAVNVQVYPDPKSYIESYKYNNSVDFKKLDDIKNIIS